MTSPSTDRRYGLDSNAAFKTPAKAKTTGAITLSGAQTIDGVSCVAGDRVLVASQSDSTTNGIYICDTGTWVLDVDSNNNFDWTSGALIFVLPGGSTNGNTWWYLSTVNPITVGTSNLTFAQVNMLSYTEPAGTTVASAATGADIWTPQGVINWTGTANTTAFANATRAWQRRQLYCTGACAFTASANLLIRGMPSGGVATMNAGALVWVTSLSTTSFEIEYSLNGSFTATGTGFTAGVTATWRYTVMNGLVRICANAAYLSGTSNDTAFTVTGFPAEITPGSNRLLFGLTCDNNGNTINTGSAVIAATGVMTLYTTAAGGAWTAANTKTLNNTELMYTL